MVVHVYFSGSVNYFYLYASVAVAASLNMSQLKDELDKTEDALARQQLKISLHSGAPKFNQSLRGVK
jgi:hypothetical protein